MFLLGQNLFIAFMLTGSICATLTLGALLYSALKDQETRPYAIAIIGVFLLFFGIASSVRADDSKEYAMPPLPENKEEYYAATEFDVRGDIKSFPKMKAQAEVLCSVVIRNRDTGEFESVYEIKDGKIVVRKLK